MVMLLSPQEGRRRSSSSQTSYDQVISSCGPDLPGKWSYVGEDEEVLHDKRKKIFEGDVVDVCEMLIVSTIDVGFWGSRGLFSSP